MTPFILSQLAAGGAVLCNLLSFQFSKRNTVVSLLSAAVFLVGVQFYFLQETAAFWLTMYALIYFITSLRTRNRNLMWLFMLGGFILFFIFFRSWLDIFPLVSTIITLLSLFTLNQKSMRELQALGASLRIIFYVIIFSPIGILLESTLLISNAVAYWRFYIKKST